MQKIKIIDLLNKVANGEEVPKKIKGRLNKIYTYSKYNTDYQDKEGKLLFYKLFQFRDKCLNEEVEIIRNTPKNKIDHLERAIFSFSAKDKNSTEESLRKLSQIVFEVREKTDEIVDKVNNLQEQINFIK